MRWQLKQGEGVVLCPFVGSGSTRLCLCPRRIGFCGYSRPTHVVSYSELDALRQCPLKRHLAYTERWKAPTTSPALSRGTLFHAVLEAHYRRKMAQQCLTQASGGTAADTLTLDVILDPWYLLQGDDEQTEIVKWVYEGYQEHYGTEPDIEVVAVELPLEAWLPAPSGKRSSYRLKGKIDLLVRDHSCGGGLWFWDHKTCSTLPSGRALDFDDQFSIYTWLLQENGYDVRGGLYNACRTKQLKRPMKMDERFSRPLTSRTPRECREVVREVYETFKSATPRQGVQPPRSPDPDRCGWKCDFTEACLMSRKGIDIKGLLVDMGYEQDFSRH